MALFRLYRLRPVEARSAIALFEVSDGCTRVVKLITPDPLAEVLDGKLAIEVQAQLHNATTGTGRYAITRHDPDDMFFRDGEIVGVDELLRAAGLPVPPDVSRVWAKYRGRGGWVLRKGTKFLRCSPDTWILRGLSEATEALHEDAVVRVSSRDVSKGYSHYNLNSSNDGQGGLIMVEQDEEDRTDAEHALREVAAAEARKNRKHTYNLQEGALGTDWVGNESDLRSFARRLEEQAIALGIPVRVRLANAGNTAEAVQIWETELGSAAWSAARDATFRCWAINRVPYPDPSLDTSEQATAFCENCSTLEWTQDMHYDDENGVWQCSACNEPTTAELNGLSDEDDSGFLP